jgi:beta-galactosidase
LGLVVLDGILGWQYYSTDSAFQQQIFQTGRDLIRRDRNHPCVIAWELSLNESWMDEPFIDQLQKITHEEYPGDQCYSAGWQEYGYDIFIQARQHRLQHYSEPSKPYSVSEYGDWEYYAMNAGFNQDSWGNLKQADRSSRQLLSDGEVRFLQQATNIQEAHNDNFNTPAFSDSYWVMFDYNRGYSPDLEASGIMSIDRLPKFSYYFYQSQRDASEKSELYQSGPMVFIASYWNEESPLNVRVFSNCEQVELFLNGISLGKQQHDSNAISNNLNHPPFTFNLKSYEKGELVAKAFIGGKEAATYSVKTPESPVKIEIKVDESHRAAKAGCNDAVFVYARLFDVNGTVIPLNGVKIDFKIEGDAKLMNQGDITTEAGIATALVKIGNTRNEIKITASDSENRKGTIQIKPL